MEFKHPGANRSSGIAGGELSFAWFTLPIAWQLHVH